MPPCSRSNKCKSRGVSELIGNAASNTTLGLEVVEPQATQRAPMASQSPRSVALPHPHPELYKGFCCMGAQRGRHPGQGPRA